MVDFFKIGDWKNSSRKGGPIFGNLILETFCLQNRLNRFWGFFGQKWSKTFDVRLFLGIRSIFDQNRSKSGPRRRSDQFRPRRSGLCYAYAFLGAESSSRAQAWQKIGQADFLRSFLVSLGRFATLPRWGCIRVWVSGHSGWSEKCMLGYFLSASGGWTRSDPRFARVEVRLGFAEPTKRRDWVGWNSSDRHRKSQNSRPDP